MKAEFALGGHCFAAPVTTTCTSLTGTAMVGLGVTTAGISVGMAVTGSDAAGSTYVSAITGANALTLSVSATALTAPTFTGDVFKMLLIKTAPSGTYTGTQTNVGTPGTAAASVTNVGTDEASGTGYTTGGFALTNISPATGSSAGFWSFTTNPNWTTATFTTTGANIYNSSVRIGHANGITANASGSAINRCISYHDFGGNQTVTAGTFTVLLPTNAQGTSILQIS